MTRLELAIEQIVKARQYTLRLLDAVEPAEWVRPPPPGVTHIAWQAGHLAIAEYYLTMERVRGVQPGDDQVIPPTFSRLFGRLTTPDPDPAKYPSPAEIRAVLDRVHQQ